MRAERGARGKLEGVYNEVNVVPKPRVPFGKRLTEENAVQRSYAKFRGSDTTIIPYCLNNFN